MKWDLAGQLGQDARVGIMTNWFGLDWFGLDWIGMDWFGLDWFGLVWIGLEGMGLDWFGLDWIGFDWFGLEWIGIGRDGIELNGWKIISHTLNDIEVEVDCSSKNGDFKVPCDSITAVNNMVCYNML